ncbi:ABC transporter permease [Ornithinibacillus sp. BX22]|uniref:ABC transporter permease n=1 Tax=Ornithinibacillus hominis TaxID=2763055 RepID=A0A923RHH6_9BACI|nr:ABC transporter permease [Ornithinibacillus hominis]MBC5636546.1 ABC transporter permease [Ornithinibacillus hominis]
MIGILNAKLKQFIRAPFTFLMFTGMSIVFALIFGGSTGPGNITVPVYAEHNVDASIIEFLELEESMKFIWVTEDELKEMVSDGKSELGVVLKEEDFQIVVGVDSFNTGLIERTIRSAYLDKRLQEQLIKQSGLTSKTEQEAFVETMKQELSEPIFSIESTSFRGEGAFVYNSNLHHIFGFSLFFVIYTIAYNVISILLEKREGIWDRMILSPVKKWEMYVANLIYSFITGYIQVAITFSVFRYIVGVDFNGRFVETLLLLIPYVFAIVALSLLITAIVKNMQQFNAILPIISVSMAMIGGAYWPIEIVESKLLLTLAKADPLYYGMQALEGIVVYGYPLSEVLIPVSVLVLMGVGMMGIGIHLMERRHI